MGRYIMNKEKILNDLVNAYATLVMAGRRTTEEVPESYVLVGSTYQLRDLVEIEVAERTIAAIIPQ